MAATVTAAPERYYVLTEDDHGTLQSVSSTADRSTADQEAARCGGFVTTTSMWAAMILADLPYETTEVTAP